MFKKAGWRLKLLVLAWFFRLLQCTRRSCFELFVQNSVNARRERDQNRESTVVVETINLIGNG